jgi:peptidoglycan/LPS O-acetylase OafA/YrhL
VALLALAAWPGLGGGVLSVPDGLRYFLFGQNLSLGTVLQGIGPAWTLCVEMSFYATLPLYAVLVERWLGGRSPVGQARRELWLLAALAVASVAVRALQHAVLDTGRGPVLAFLLPSFVLWFGLGMALAVLSATGAAPRLHAAVARHPGACWLLAAALLALAAFGMDLPQGFLGAYTDLTWAGEHVVYAAIAVCLLAPATLGVHGGGAVRRLLAWRPLAVLGLISYGIYLYHLPLLIEFGARGWPHRLLPFAPTLGSALLTLAAAGAAAAVSYRVVERPFLARKLRRVRPDAVPVPVGDSLSETV